jgi:hypothetical protein
MKALVLPDEQVHPVHPICAILPGHVIRELDAAELKVTERLAFGIARKVDGSLQFKDGQARRGLE